MKLLFQVKTAAINLFVAAFVVAVVASVAGGVWLTISHSNPAWLILTAIGLAFLL